MCRRFGFVTAIVLASLLISVQVQAAPITLIEGDLPLTTASVAAAGVAGPVGNLFAISFVTVTGFTTELNGLPAGQLLTVFPDLILGVITGTSVNGSITTYAYSSSFQKTIFAPDGAAVFQLTVTSTEVDSLNPSILVLRGTETLADDTSATLDFSPFASGGLFRFTLVNPGDVNFNTILADGGSIANSAGFFEQSVAPAAVPEPASMSLLGLGLAGLGARRWRQRHTP